jgi:hypothetical protein
MQKASAGASAPHLLLQQGSLGLKLRRGRPGRCGHGRRRAERERAGLRAAQRRAEQLGRRRKALHHAGVAGRERRRGGCVDDDAVRRG